MDKATGRSRGFGFVDFQDEDGMEAALSMSHEVDGVRVSVSAYTDKQQPPSRGGSRDVSAAAADILNNTLGLVAKQLQAGLTGRGRHEGGRPTAARESPKEQDRLPLRLFVSGLDQSITVDMLQESFGQHGHCECEVVMDKYSGRSRGFGFVQYFNEDDAAAAADSTNFVNGRRVEVSECFGKGSSRGSTSGSIRSSPY